MNGLTIRVVFAVMSIVAIVGALTALSPAALAVEPAHGYALTVDNTSCDGFTVDWTGSDSEPLVLIAQRTTVDPPTEVSYEMESVSSTDLLLYSEYNFLIQWQGEGDWFTVDNLESLDGAYFAAGGCGYGTWTVTPTATCEGLEYEGTAQGNVGYLTFDVGVFGKGGVSVPFAANFTTGVLPFWGAFDWFVLDRSPQGGGIVDTGIDVFSGPPTECDNALGSVVVYDEVGGGVSVVDVNSSGDGFTSPSPSVTVSGADTVGTAYLGGPDTTVDDILFYSSTTGNFKFASVSAPDASGDRDVDVFVDVDGTTGWTHVVTGDYNGDGTGDVLFYRQRDGLLRFYTTSSSGAFTPLTETYFGTTGWTHLVVGDYNGDGSDDVMWYRARDGLLRFYEVDDVGVFKSLTPAYFGTQNWSSIPAGDYNGDGTDDVLFYRGDSVARFYEVDATGTFVALGAAFTPGAGFAQIEAVEFTPTTPGEDLAWYHAGNQELSATKYDTNDVVELWPAQSTTGYGTDLIIATGVFPRLG